MVLAALLLPASARAAAPTVRDVDPVTRTPRVLARLDGALAGPRKGTAHEVALAYVRANLKTLGLKDLDTLESPTITKTGDLTQVRWRQGVDGVTAADSELRVNVTSDGRVLSVLGSPAPDLPTDTTPKLDARAAIKAAGARNPSTPTLEFFTQRLAWRLNYRASSDAVYDVTVDAQTGKVLKRVNLVKSDTAVKVWDNYPGAPLGGDRHDFNLPTSWLADNAPTLDGANVHAYSDINDDDTPNSGEEFAAAGYAFTSFPGTGCADTSQCSWNPFALRSWDADRAQNAVQAFYLANVFHDHLKAAPIAFTDRPFDGDDKLILQTDDGAATGSGANNPNSLHTSNANMFTPVDGKSPVMQMYLWTNPHRAMNGGDDASILFHEYTHGLTNRLVTDADGAGALNSDQAGAMGEGWSDWYAKDFLVKKFPQLDSSAAGDVDLGDYTDTDQRPNQTRYQGLDCPVGVVAEYPRCQGSTRTGAGGFTYEDFGDIDGAPEVHADGEIWAETLWDLRQQLPNADVAEKLITDALRLTPPEPSFLDGRNAILQADTALGGTYHDTIWRVFAARGMGYYATSSSGDDDAPLADTATPPDATTPRGQISGRVTDLQTGAPVPAVTVSIGGMTSGPDALAATTGADGRYTLSRVPAHTYANVLIQGPAYDHVVLHDVAVTADATTPLDATLRRDWAARAGGATATSTGNEYADYGCGPNVAIDQRLESTWSTAKGAPKPLVVALPQSVDVTGFGMDPSAGCGDDASASTNHYTVETAPSATGPWTQLADRSNDSAGVGLIEVTAAASGVRFVRLTPLSNRGGSFIDVSEFAVYGVAHGGVPDTTITSGPSGSTSSHDAAFTFIGGGTYECAWDSDTDFEPCVSGVTRHFDDERLHTFAVRASDVNGTDPTPATRSWTIDSTAPSIQLDGSGAGDAATFTFSAPDATSLTCAFDDAATPCVSPARFSGLPDGTHTFAVTARDAAGNVAAKTASVEIDVTPPVTAMTFAPPPILTVRDFDLGFAANEPASFVCAVDGGAPTACSSPLALRNLGDGAHTVTVTATDAHGNRQATPASTTFTVAVPRPAPTVTPTPTPVPTVTAKRSALVSVSVAKKVSLKALRKARRLKVTVRAASGARVSVQGKLGAKVLGKLSKSSRGVAMKLSLPLDARRLRAAKKGSTVTIRVSAAGSGLVARTRTFKLKLTS